MPYAFQRKASNLSQIIGPLNDRQASEDGALYRSRSFNLKLFESLKSSETKNEPTDGLNGVHQSGLTQSQSVVYKIIATLTPVKLAVTAREADQAATIGRHQR